MRILTPRWLVLGTFLGLAPLHLPAGDPATLSGLDLPWPAVLENAARSCRVLGPAEFELVAPGKTDLFVSPEGDYRTDRSPRVLFRPEGPFILTTKITPEFRTKWDAGDLLLFNDATHFAKFCYEQDYQGTPRVVSVVCNGTADDCNSMAVPEGAVYFRIVGAVPGETFTFYTSPDGENWFSLRSFRLMRTEALRVGFSAQSPVGDGCVVRFSEIRVERRVPKDRWLGD